MRCLIQFYQDFHWIKFRHAELDELLRMHGVDPSGAYTDLVHDDEQAFLFIELPTVEVIRSICRRSVMIRNIYELWASAESFTDLVTQVQSLSATFLASYTSVEKSWCVQVDSFCRSYTMQQKEK
jgi:tRNA G10  N-methylase Trm11